MISPFFNGGGGNVSFMPPPGLAQMIAEREKETTQNLSQLGKMAGGIAGGAVGAFQGAADPGQFGAGSPGTPAGGADGTDWSNPGTPATPGTSAFSGAVQGFAHNYQNIMGGGSNFSDMVQGDGSGGGMSGGNGMTGGGTPNFKQLQQMGKSADAFRKAAKYNAPSMGGDDPTVLGKTDEEWNTMGSSARWQTVAQQFQQQRYADLMQGYDAAHQNILATAQLMAQRQQQMDEQRAAAMEDNAFQEQARMAPIMAGRGPGRTTFQDVQDAAYAHPTAPSARGVIDASARWGNQDIYKVEEGSSGAGTPYVTYGHQFSWDPSATAKTKEQSAADLYDHKRAALGDEPPDPPQGNPGKGMHWAWKGARTGYVSEKDAKADSMDVLRAGGAGSPAPAPALRFRKNPTTGKIESY